MLVLAVAALVAAVGLFHSYVVNIAYNLVAGGLRAVLVVVLLALHL